MNVATGNRVGGFRDSRSESTGLPGSSGRGREVLREECGYLAGGLFG